MTDRSASSVPVVGVLLYLWRAAVLFRAVGALLVVYLIARWYDLYAVPGVALGVGAVVVIVTAVVAVLGWTGRAHRVAFVGADLAVCLVLTLLTRVAQHASQFHGGMLTLTTFWAAGPVIETGLVLGTAAGVIAGIVQLIATLVVREGYDGRTLLNGLLLVVVGGLAGFITALTVRAERDRAVLAAERARLAERERLTRSIHDGVLQVLSLVHRRGVAAGGEWSDLGREAAAQEAALRALISRAALPPTPSGMRNLAAELVVLRSSRVIVAVPDTQVLLPSHRAAEVVDAVREALHNVDKHVGPDATAWVFLDVLPGQLSLTIRDNGPGIAPGRLATARAEGRLGVDKSICGRIADLGGTVTISSPRGAGTEIELIVPIADPRDVPA